MKLLKLKKQIFACLCGLFMLLGVGGIVAMQQNRTLFIISRLLIYRYAKIAIKMDLKKMVGPNSGYVGRIYYICTLELCARARIMCVRMRRTERNNA